MRGDIVLYSGSTPSEMVIRWATHGPYSHVEIDLGNGEMLGALARGIVRHPFDKSAKVAVIRPKTSVENMEHGLAWALKQEGKEYGWADIVSNGLKLVGIPFDIAEPGHYDCSDLVTRYLIVAQAASPLGTKAENPGLVSPNDIARAFGVL